MSGDPAHTALGFVPASERTSLGPAGGPNPGISGAWYYAGFLEDYARQSFLDACYKGGPRFKEGKDRDGKDIFLKHERESDTRYLRRRAMTTYRNYVGPIVDQYAMYVGSSKPQRSAREAFTEWCKNADGANGDWHSVITHALSKGLLLGRWVVGMVLPEAVQPANGAPLTKENDKRVPYAVHIHPSNVVDYEQDGNGRFVRLVIHYQFRRKAGFGVQEVVEHEYHEWTAQHVVVWKPVNPTPPTPQDQNGGQQTTPNTTMQLAAGAPKPHGYKQIPFRMLWLLEGKGIVEDVAECNKTVLNLNGLLYEELYNNTFSQTFISGASAEEQGDTKLGTSTIIFLNSPEAKVSRVGADAQQAASIINALFLEVKEIHRMAHMEQSGEPLQKRVAEAASKVEKSHESMDQVLEHVADKIQWLENELLGIAATYDTDAVKPADVVTVWARIFDTKTLREKISLAIELDKVPYAPRLLLKGLARQIMAEVIEDPKKLAEAVAEIDKMDRARSPVESALAKAGYAAGALGPVEWFKIFVDPTKTDDEIRVILEQIAKDRMKFAPVAAPKGGEGEERPANRPEKQPTPEEQRKATEKQQAANQT